MKYNLLGNTGLQVSEIGLGCEHLEKMSYEEVLPVIDAAIEAGINIFDVFMSEPNVRTNIGKALVGRREKVVLQGHIGAAWIDGQYKRTRDISLVKPAFEDFLTRLKTDYVDIGMIHFVDTQEDFDQVFGGPVIDYAKQLKKDGVIKAVGMSSHNPQIALKAVQTGQIDVLMFSLNPAYDLLPEDTQIGGLFEAESFKKEGLLGINPVRSELYATCQSMGVGITVMKSLGAGALLKAETSPFGTPLSVISCIHYALDRPGVASVMVGCRTPQEVQQARAYEDADEKERDYSVILGSNPRYSLVGKCMYCNHCLPCPSGIDIAQVNKLLDLATLQNQVPPTVKEHYLALPVNASDCIGCGSCEQNCPFSVSVIERMEKAVIVFG